MAGAAAVRGRPDGDRRVRRRADASRGNCSPPRGTPGPGCTSTAASPTCPSRRCRWPAGSTSSSPTSPTSGCTRRAARSAAGIEPVPLTPADGGFRFADLVLSPDGQEIWCVRETVRPVDGDAVPDGFHLGGGMAVRREIVAVPLDGSAASDAAAIRVLVSGAQFFAFPTPSPDGTRLAWISWNHPNMPWDGTELRVAPVTGETVRVADATLVMGGPRRVGARPALARRRDALRDLRRLRLVEPLRGGRLRRGRAAAAAPAGRGIRRAAVAARRAAVRAARATAGSRCCTASASSASACSTRPPGN